MLNLVSGVTLKGTVTAGATGAPVADAAIVLFAGNDVIVTGSSNAAGQYVFPTLRPGTYTAMVVAENLARAWVEVTIADEPQRVDLALVSESAATGTMTLSDKQPVHELGVIALRQGGEPFSFFADVYETGKFRLGLLAEGVYDFEVVHPGYNSVVIENVVVLQGETVDLGLINLATTGTLASIISSALPAASPALPGPISLAMYLTAKLLLVANAHATHDAGTLRVVERYFDGPHGGGEEVVGGKIFADDPQTEKALRELLTHISDAAPFLREVSEYLDTYDPCNPRTFFIEYKLADLASEPVLSGTLPERLFVNSASSVAPLWAYEGGIGTPPAFIAGGVGEGGPPPLGAPSTPDTREISGGVRIYIDTDGHSWIVGDFHVDIHDTFDFLPGGTGPIEKGDFGPFSLITAAGVGGLRLFEILGVTFDVPFRTSFDKSLDQEFTIPQRLFNHNCFGRRIRRPTSIDPNAIAGPNGFGEPRFIREETLPYTIFFENDPEKATAPAQEVVITQQLDADLDWTSFELGDFGFGSVFLDVPDGLKSYQTQIIHQNLDGSPLLVNVQAGLNVLTGVVTWAFRSVDPATGLLPDDPFHGFLPVDDETGRGEGSVNYFIRQLPGLETGTTLDAQASIVFDVNAPLATNTHTNTIDAAPPTSTINALPAFSPPTFNVSWTGEDDSAGSGIASYDVFVSVNSGPFAVWLDDTAATSAIFTGELGHTYGFFSVATDNVGIRQAAPGAAQATTLITGSGPRVTDVRIQSNRARTSIARIILSFDSALAPLSANNPASFRLHTAGRDKRIDTGDDVRLPIADAVYDDARRTVTLKPPTRRLKLNQFIRVSALGTGGVTDSIGTALDGDANNAPGGNFVRSLGIGTTLSYTDASGDIVSLTLKRGGLVEISLPSTGDPTARLTGTVAGSSRLTGSVKKPRSGGDGQTSLASIAGSAGVNLNDLPICGSGSPPRATRCFDVAAISATVVDMLFESNEPLTIKPSTRNPNGRAGDG
jgi:hypothetical protein